MNTNNSPDQIKRRQFFAKSCSIGTSLCFGCSQFFSLANAQDNDTDKQYQEKIARNSGMSYVQVFNFAYRDLLIPQLFEISNQVGREKFIEILKTASDNVYSQREIVKRFYANMPKPFMRDVLNLEVLEKLEKVQINKVTKCLWAKTFREAEAADIGYALLCYGDYADARAQNRTLVRETSLMQGDEHCLFKWTKI